jgi:hypothetical protein
MTVEKIEPFSIPAPEKQKVLYKITRTLENIPGVTSITWVDTQLTPWAGELILPQMTYKLTRTTREEALKLAEVFFNQKSGNFFSVLLNIFVHSFRAGKSPAVLRSCGPVALRRREPICSTITMVKKLKAASGS